MNRIIKFRAWQKHKNKMLLWEELQDWNFVDFNFAGSETVFMQFTGLTDKNGKEIYESDYLDDEWCVFWGSGKYILHNISTGDIIDCNEQNTQTKSITGNRYESPREHKAMASDL